MPGTSAHAHHIAAFHGGEAAFAKPDACETLAIGAWMRQAQPNPSVRGSAPPRAAYWSLVVLLCAAFALGGSARSDVASLLVLRPLAACMLAFALVTLRRQDFAEHRLALIGAALVVCLPLAQLIPLPPTIWTALPGRELVAQVDAAIGLADQWRPLSLAPPETLDAAFALLLPLAILLLGIRLDEPALRSLVMLVLVLGGISALLGIAQLLGSDASPAYLFEVTNRGSAVGVFANRNHQALLLACLFPMLGLAACSRSYNAGLHGLLASLAGLLLIPLLLITGSRSGLILGLAALAMTVPVIGRGALRELGHTRLPRRAMYRVVLIGLAAALAGVTIVLGKAVAWDRIFLSNPADDARARILPVIWSMVREYNLAGTGMGSFLRVYQIHEPDELLASYYMNHAHNDWLELLLTGGLPGGVLLLAALVSTTWLATRLFAAGAYKSTVLALPRLGLCVIVLIALASISDYPLRTPAISALFAVAVLWFTCPIRNLSPLPQVSESGSNMTP